MHNHQLNGRTALVTGGAGLLGRHFCSALAQSGASLIVADSDIDAAQSTVEHLNKTASLGSYAVKCDVANPQSVRDMIESIEQRNQTIDILVNNAATKTSDLDAFFEPFETYSLNTWREVNSVNLDGMFLIAQAVGNHMIKRQVSGSIIQIASVYGVVSPDQRIYEGSEYNGRGINSPAIYSVSKAGVIALSNYLATYWADKGIRVNTISPGGIYSGQNNRFVDRYSERVPMSRMGSAEELLGALLLLASDGSTYINGQNLVVDGGLSSW